MNFEKTRCATDYILSLLLIIGGITMAIVPTSIPINIAGLLFAFTGIVLILVMRTGFRNSETKERFRRKTYYFPASYKSQLISGLENNPKLIEVDNDSIGNGVMLELFYNSKCPKVFAKAYEYRPYKYEACSDFIELEREQAENFI